VSQAVKAANRATALKYGIGKQAQVPSRPCALLARRYSPAFIIPCWRSSVNGAEHVFRSAFMLISPAYAQSGGDAAGIMSFLPLVLIFAVFYFLLIRPQQKKMKQHKETIATLRRNDKIVTGGGIIGKVIKVIDDHEIDVEIAPNTVVRIARSTVADVIAKSAPTGEAARSAPKPANDTGSGASQGGLSGFLAKIRGEK